MADSALGSALIIPESALKKIKEADERLEKIKVTAEQTASSVKASFGTMQGSTSGFISALDQIITKLGTIDSKASKMSGSLSNLGAEKAAQQVGQMNSVIVQAAENIDKMSNKKVSLNFSTMNIAEIKESIKGINAQLIDTENLLNKQAQQALVNMRSALQEELKEQERSTQKRILSEQKVTDAVNKETDKETQKYLDSLSLRITEAQKYKERMEYIQSMRTNIGNNAQASVDAEIQKENDAYLKKLEERFQEAQSYQKRMSDLTDKRAKIDAEAAKSVEKEIKKDNDNYLRSLELRFQQAQAYQARMKVIQEQQTEAERKTYSGSLKYSATTNSFREDVKAIEYLKEAKMSLSQSDANYKQKLATLNAAIDEHNKKLKEAGVNSRALAEQTSYMAGYMSRWAQRMAFAFSMGSIKSFVEQIAEVRGQFELSERSLEAILQNKPKADEIFNKTVELAVKSPFRIKDLVDYTRQLSAYRIESDKLYDTTKRLADVSAGLGVDMGRLILAYGQVKAAAYLRGSEVRQFTEAGINMYGELQQYFKEVKGEAYTTAQIVDMISKRKVTFEDVEAIFQRMTDKGGTFYNMQEIQAETLQGKISNLKDAFDVMLNDIGKANEGTFKGMISGATEMLSNWKTILNVAKLFAGVLASIYITTKLTNGAWGQTAANIMASHKKLGVFKALMAALTGDTGKLGSSFAAVGKTIAASLPLAALMATIALVQELISVNNEYKESMAKNTKEYYTAQVRVDEIDAESKTNIQKALQDLVKEMNQKGFEVKIGVNLSEEEAKKQYETFLEDYQEFLDDMRAIDARYEANKKKGWIMGDDDIETDMQEYAESMGEFLQKGDDVRSILAQVSQESINLTDSQKKLFEQLAAGPQKGQNLIDYYSKVAKALEQIGYIKDGVFGNKQNMVGILGGTGNNGYDWGIGADADKQLSEFAMAYETYIKDLEEVRKEAQSVFGDVSKYQDEASRKKLKIRIDNEAIKRGWSDIEKDMLYKEYKINVKFDKNDTQKQIDSIKQQMDRAFSNNTYHITFTYDPVSLDPKSAYGEFDANAQDKLKQLQSLVTQRHNLKGGTMKLAGYNEAATTREINDLYRDISHLGQGYKEAADRIMGYNKTRKNTTKHDKAQRDILQERISLLKDMNLKYDELIKKESKETALSKTRKYFKEAAQNVGWKASDILPDDKSVAKRVREIGSQYKELSKRGNAYRISADIDLKVSEKEYNELKDDISRNIDDAFSQLQLYKKLKGEGLSEEIIKSMFGDIASSFMDVQYKIDEEFNKYIIKEYETKYGKDFTKWGDKVLQQYNSELADTEGTLKKRFTGSDILKEYLEKKQKLNQQVNQDSVSQAQELIKAYKQQLSDQLQLDKWYIEEKNKLQTNAEISKNPELQKQLLDNLDKQYEQKTDANTWKDFQDSDMYIAIFENLDHTSSRVLKAIKERLAGLRSELKGLSPEQVKQIVNEIEKIDELLVERNPYKNIGKNFNNYLDFAKKRKRLEEEYIKAEEREEELKKQAENANKNVLLSQKAYNAVKEKYGEESKEAQQAGILLACNKANLEIILSQLEAQKKITEEQAEQIRNGQKVGKTLQDQLQQIGTNISDVANSVSSMFDMMNDWGINVEMSDELSEVVSGIDKIGSSLSSIDLSRPFSVISGTVGVLGGIGKTLGGIFGWGTKDKKLQNGIEEHQKAIEKLQDAYNDLKEAMDNAYDIAKLSKYNDEMVENLKKQNTYLESMIKAEQDKKKTDDEKIEEYRKQIEENNKAIKEIQQSLTEQLGGFGGDSNYKSAAEAFADAWVDAFNEGSDALEALNDKFDEYFNNLLKKQIMLRASEKYIKPILKAIDDAVSEGSEGGENGMELTEGEIAQIKKLKDENLAAYNEYVKGVMKAMGVSPTGGSNISALQQGIQSVTESTAQALESVLNSVRYYVATQQADIRIIRDTLLERLGTAINAVQQDTSSSPVLIELRLQTTILTDIRDTLSSCVKGGHRQGRNGIKVFMN